MPTDPITAAIRRHLAASEPMWRDEYLDGMAAGIAAAVHAETPATTDDAVEEVLGFLDEMNAGGHISYGDYSHLHDLVAALAAADARGDVATPTVTAEQVERARLSEPMTYPPGQQVSRAAAHHLLASLGIEVAP